MSELLTVKEVQNLLKIDRITVYRMLKDGKLTGVKIGHQWRFSRQEIDSLLSGGATKPRTGEAEAPTELPSIIAPQALPIHCVQMIQNVFSEIAQVASVTTGPDGQPLTAFSGSCAFCELIMSSEQGRQACVASWSRLSEQKERQPRFATCHAGLQYARARIEVDNELAAMLIAGQFYTEAPDAEEVSERTQRLAQTYGIEAEALFEAAQHLPVLDERKRAALGAWLESVAHTFEDIARERTGLMNRLRTIAAMSTLEAS
jgi:excisionase family DNA binding protein